MCFAWLAQLGDYVTETTSTIKGVEMCVKARVVGIYEIDS